MIILAIETSCDDTCVAIVEADKRGYQRGFTRMKILSNVVSSQVKLHAKYGGVYPFLAKREHQKNLPIVFKKAPKGAKLLEKEIDLIAVTVGPGLEPCLWTGVNFAKKLAEDLKLQIIPVNHIEAHILANFINLKSEILNLKSIFPAVCLVVSGGHTQLILMKNIGKYKIIGETRDDAAGECFDKVARILGLGYPGGPIVAKMATKIKNIIKRDVIPIKLPRPMIYQKNYDFSFSGLKTAVLYKIKGERLKMKDEKYIQAIAAEAQQAIIDVLIYKTLKAAKKYKAKSIILGGGVAANDELRRQFQRVCSRWHLKHLVPPKNLCTDNAAMVAATAYFRFKISDLRFKKNWKNIKADANLRLRPNHHPS